MTIDDTAAPAAPKRRGAYAKTEEKRRAILEAALEVFAQSGYRSGSLRDVAAKVGMSEAGLLHHFPNKSSLLAAVLDVRDDHSRELIAIGPDAGVETLRGLVYLAEYNAGVPGVVELYCTLSAEATTPDHPAHDYFVRRYVFTRGMVAGAFETMRQRGELREGVLPESAARSTIALMDGLQVQWLLDRSALDMADELRRYLAGLITIEL